MNEEVRKIAVIVPRYGENLRGAVPEFAYHLVKRLKSFYSIDVLTSTASDFETWENSMDDGETVDDDIHIIRFRTTQTRDMASFEKLDELRRNLGIAGGMLDQKRIYEQGPVVRGLIAYLRENVDRYDRFLFVTFQYFPTVYGLPHVAEKSILIPFADPVKDEKHVNYKIYRELFDSARVLIFRDENEKKFVSRVVKKSTVGKVVAGSGIEVPDYLADPDERIDAIARFRKKYGISGDYIIYNGRICKETGCDEMFRIFKAFHEVHPDSPLHLLAIGKPDADMALPPGIGAYYPGFVSEKEKLSAMAGAKYQWIPSKEDCAPTGFLNGLILGVPGIVNEGAGRTAKEAKLSESAYIYKTAEDCLTLIEEAEKSAGEGYDLLSVRSKIYARDNYGWGSVMKTVRNAIEA